MWLAKDGILIILIPVILVAMAISVIKRYSFCKTIAAIAFAYCLCLVISETQLPFLVLPNQFDYEMISDQGLNLVPLMGIVDYASSITGSYGWVSAVKFLVGKSLVFAPAAFLAPFFFPSLANFRRAFVWGAVFAALSEIIQLINGLRVGIFYQAVSVDDFILGLVGCMVGYGLYRVANVLFRRVKRVKGESGKGLAFSESRQVNDANGQTQSKS